MFLAALNTEIIKYVIFFCAIPLWLPFLKALITELDDALAAEGGLFGRPPTQKELAYIERDPNRAKSPLVSRDFDPDNPRGSEQSQGARRNSSAPSRAGAPAKSPRGGASAKVGFSKPRAARGFSRKDQRGR